MKWIILALIFCMRSFPVSGMQQDTLFLKEYLKAVLTNHPLIKKSMQFDEITLAYDLKAKGVLDPKIGSSLDNKFFNDQDYFTIWQAEAKVPTRLPIDFSIGYEQNDGLFLNPEASVPSNGLIYGTINLSILRGLLFDEQRYQIKQSELDGLKSQIDKDILVREIVYQAIKTYLQWVYAQNQLAINANFLNLITERHVNVVRLFTNGDIPAIDTIESMLNINSAQKLELDAQDKLIKAVQELSLFIWDDNGNPLSMNTSVQSMRLDALIRELQILAELLDPSFEEDPLIRKIDNEVASLELANRLEKEQLKPQLDLKYNTIVNLGKEALDPSFSFNDYKYGIGFQLPILNRKTRGEIDLNNALIRQNEFEKIQYLYELNNKFEGLRNRQAVQSNVLVVSEEKVKNSETLLEAEQLKFNLGESSIFLLNQRERKLLESRLDLVKSYSFLGAILNDLYYLKIGQSSLN